MLKILNVIVVSAFLFSLTSENFLDEQKRYKRVREAIQEKEEKLKTLLATHDLKLTAVEIVLVAFKDEGELQVHAKSRGANKYKLLKTYPICRKSGELGPKRKQGDLQVPEGFYHIDRYNPASSYHLSLGINYPNSSDRIKSKATNLGGDIFIHGECVTIGCLPMTNDKIKEIYLLSIYAHNYGQKEIPVYIFPFKMTEMKFEYKKIQYGNNKELVDFWKNLKIGYDLFVSNHKTLDFSIDSNGDYSFKD